MTVEQVEQWRKERDIALKTGNVEAIQEVERHRAEMLMDCQQKTATRVKELIARQTEISENFKELKESLNEQKGELTRLTKQSNDMDAKLIGKFEKLEKIIENNDLKAQLKEAEIRGGKKTFNVVMYVITAVCSCGGGAIVLKLIDYLSNHQIS